MKSANRYLNGFLAFFLALTSIALAQNLRDFYPAHSPDDQIIAYTAYALSYSEEHEQAQWVIYFLTRERLGGPVERTDDFRPDPDVATGSASLADYRGSGYDRGHLAPAGDMTWSATAMSESFFMSNMSPQKPGFNRGVWKRLESLVRFWAVENEEIYVVTGPVLSDGLPTIGPNKVSMPRYYYKVVLDYKEPEIKGIGFILQNESSSASLQGFAVTIDSVEVFTGIDFFPGLPDDVEDRVEAQGAGAWNFTGGAGGSPGGAAAAAIKADPSKIEAPFVGSVRSDKFHKRECRYVSQINQANLVTWPSAEAALQVGRVPCKVCNPSPAVVTEQPKQKATSDVTVYVTKTGKKYHRSGCRYLRRSAIPMKLSAAKGRYGPCSVCKPPR